MTAEELKGYVRDYADEQLPGWSVVSVMIHHPLADDMPAESLVVIRLPAVTDSADDS